MKKKLNLAIFPAMIVFSVIIVVNLFGISITNNGKYQAMANNNQFQSTVVNANRGSIYDANGKILAQSATVYSIILNPNRLNDADNEKVVEETGKTERQRQIDACVTILTEELDNVTAGEIQKKLSDLNSKW